MSSLWEPWPGCGIGSARSENSGALSGSGAALPGPRPSSRNQSNDSVSNVHGLGTARNGAGRQGTAHIYHPQSRKKCMCFCDPPRKFLHGIRHAPRHIENGFRQTEARWLVSILIDASMNSPRAEIHLYTKHCIIVVYKGICARKKALVTDSCRPTKQNTYSYRAYLGVKLVLSFIMSRGFL